MANYTPPQVSPDGASVRQHLAWPIQASSAQQVVGGGTNAAVTVAIQADATTAPRIDGATNTGGIATPVPNYLSKVWWSYSAAGAGRLTIAGATVGTVLDIDIIAGGKDSMDFYPPLAFNSGEAVTLTLGAVAAVTGKLGCIAWKLK